jgi:hypothetical protein
MSKYSRLEPVLLRPPDRATDSVFRRAASEFRGTSDDEMFRCAVLAPFCEEAETVELEFLSQSERAETRLSVTPSDGGELSRVELVSRNHIIGLPLE